MFLSRTDIRQIAVRDVIPVFSGVDGCLAGWPDCCLPWYSPKQPKQPGRYPNYSPELLAAVERDLKAGAKNIDISVTYDLNLDCVSTIRKILGMPGQHGAPRKYRARKYSL